MMRPLRHGYTNDVRTDGSTVVKRYVGAAAAARRETERVVLAGLPEALPIPRVLAAPDDTLVFAHLPGMPAQELIDAGHAAEVLRSCGELLRRLQQLDAGSVFPGREGAVVVHGDFGPNNMLVDPAAFAVTGLVDWEWAHAGDPLEDLAWCEWIIRMHHPGVVGALDHLFAGYGSRPPWPLRQAAATARCVEMIEVIRAGPDPFRRVRSWQNRAAITRSWSE